MPKKTKQEKLSEKVDKGSVAGTLRDNRRKKEKALQDIFDDNSTGRPQHPDSD